jgi:hypothetical protein
MHRRTFIAAAAAIAATSATAFRAAQNSRAKRPRAITMWEFSWIERRWSGAGYEDWDRALDELRDRGYDAVRIDPFPHLLAADPHKTWTLLPEWSVQDWGSPDVNRIVLLPALFEFLQKCRQRGIKVGLSTWYRKDQDDTRLKITSPEIHATQWIRTLDFIAEAGLLDDILYVDLCNEWPGEDWAPFAPGHITYGQWDNPASVEWMHKAIALVREKYADLPLFFSVATGNMQSFLTQDLHDFDLLDPHIWMTQGNGGEFYKLTGYNYERFDGKGYTNLSLKADDTYRARPGYWQGLLTSQIDAFAEVSAKIGKPLITTECWGIVDYKDWPLLKWNWVQELCVLGVTRAAASHRWLAIASSNFCGPQFVGMWRDRDWHRRVTEIIKTAEIAPELRQGRFYERL